MAASLDGVLIKKANRKETYTEEQVADLLACMDPDTGYLYFARKFAFIQHPTKGKLLFDPYEYQLRKYQENSIFEPQQLIRHNLRSENISVYDCSDFLIKRGYKSRDLYLYGDGIHFSEYGHQLMQEFIFDVVLAESDLKKII